MEQKLDVDPTVILHLSACVGSLNCPRGKEGSTKSPVKFYSQMGVDQKVLYMG